MKKRYFALGIVFIALCAILCSCSFLGGNNSGSNSGTKKPETGNTGDNNEIFFVFHDVPESFGATANDFYNPKTGFLRIPVEEPTKLGYKFENWYSDKDYNVPFPVGTKPASKEVHIYAKWKVATYTVSVYDDLNGTQRYTVEYNHIPELVEPTRDGYVFGGWYTDQEYMWRYNNDKISSNLNLFVKWDYQKYEINYETYGGRLDKDAIFEYSIVDTVELAEPKKTDYVFDGWYDNEEFLGEPVTEISDSRGDKYFYAKYRCNLSRIEAKTGLSSVNQRTLSCEFYSDSDAKSINLEDYFVFSTGSKYLIYKRQNDTIDKAEVKVNANLIKSNRISLEENTENGLLRSRYIVMVISEAEEAFSDYELTIYQYDNNIVTIKYYIDRIDGEMINEVQINKGNPTVEYVWNGERVGYEFMYWTNERGTEFIFGSLLTESIKLCAKFKPIVYSIEYSLGSGINSSANKTQYTIEDDIALENPACLEGYGYVFEGWYTDPDFTEDSKLSAITATAGDLKLYARYAKEPLFDFEIGSDGKYNITKNEYEKFINYVVFNSITSVELVITDMSTEEELIALNNNGVKISVPFNDYTQSTSYMLKDGMMYLQLTFNYLYGEPTNVSEVGMYNQVNFTKWIDGEGREDYTDFGINHIKTTINVSTGNQLFYAILNGYKPICEEGSVAEEVYEESKNVLNTILSVGMSDKDKAMAIAEYLIETVAYDNYVLNMYKALDDPKLSESDKEILKSELKQYRSFSPEAAILDKVAVCDGISKAYVILCGIEGIRAVQVDGTNKSVKHAWNKVYVDVDGDGRKEWTVVDCTAANTLIGGMEIEIVNHAFIFATDEMILSSAVGYLYNNEWRDNLGNYKYPTNIIINVYDTYKFTSANGSEYSLYAETKDELEEIFKYYNELFQTQESGRYCFDFCINAELKNLDWRRDPWLASKIGEIFGVSPMFSQNEAQNQENGDCIMILILEK